MTETHTQIRERFAQANRIAVISHVRPDGDAVGSVLGLGTALVEAGKDVVFVLADGAGATYKFLKHYGKIKKTIQQSVDLTVVLDCSDPERIGGVLNGSTPDINIDHHKTNLHYAKINLVEDSAATTQILTNHIEKWGLTISKDVAEALMTGLLTDTIGFRTSNVTVETMKATAELMTHEIDMPEIYQRVLIDRTFAGVALWGCAIPRMTKEGGILYTKLTVKDRKKVHYPGKDDAELITVLSSIRETNITILFIEQDSEHVKVSWRAKPGYDVSGVALFFDGGGHAPAAGATVLGALDDVVARVLKETKKITKKLG